MKNSVTQKYVAKTWLNIPLKTFFFLIKKHKNQQEQQTCHIQFYMENTIENPASLHFLSSLVQTPPRKYVPMPGDSANSLSCWHYKRNQRTAGSLSAMQTQALSFKFLFVFHVINRVENWKKFKICPDS